MNAVISNKKVDMTERVGVIYNLFISNEVASAT